MSLAIAPNFTPTDHGGRGVALRSSFGPRVAVLVFYRGHRCPYCRRYLAKVQANYAQFAERGVAVLGISSEPAPTSAELARELGIAFPLLSDVDCAVIEAYGVRSNFTGATPFLPHPAVFVLAPDRAVRFKSIDRNDKRRTPVSALHRAAESLAVGATA